MKKIIAFLMTLILLIGLIPVAGSNEIDLGDFSNPATPTDLQPVYYDYTINLSNLPSYSIVALHNATLNGHVRGSIWVGGELNGGEWKFVDDGSIGGNSPTDSYVHINNSSIQFKGRTSVQSTNMYRLLTDAAISNTRGYWQNIVANAGENETWIYLEPDENGHVEIMAWDYQCPGSDESQSSINKIYWTDATSVTMGGLAGHLIAPYANVTVVNCNHCGSIVAKNITTSGESHINYWTPPSPPEKPTPTPEPTPTPTPLTVTKVLNGEIWSLRCDTMDNTNFTAGGGYWMADINNPTHNTSKEGHRSNHCGNRENWVLFVSEEGKAISLYQLKSGSTGGTLPSIVYRAPADLRSIPEGQFIYDPTDPNDIMTKRLIEEVFIPQNAMPFSEINLVEGQRLFWISQNGKQVWHHTGVLKKTTPRFAFIINGEPYTLGVGETITLTEVEEGLLEIEEIATSNYKMVEITNDGEGNYVVINEIDPPDKPTPTPPPPVVTPTPTPSPTPEETESPSPTPEETETPSPTPEETETPSPTPEETETPSPTPEETETPSPTPEVTDEPSPSPDPTCGFTIKKIVSNKELMDDDVIFFFQIHGVGFEEDEFIEITVDHTTGIGTFYIEGLKPGKYSIKEIDIPAEFELVSDEQITLYIHNFDTVFEFTNKVKEPEESPSPSPSPEVSESPSPSPEVSESPSPSPSRTPPPTTVTPSEVPSDSPTPSPTPSPSPTVTTSPIPSETPEESETPSPTPSPTPEETEEPEESPTPSPTPSETPQPTPLPTMTPEPLPEVTPTPEPWEEPDVETTIIGVRKRWNDDGYQVVRPQLATVRLLADGQVLKVVKLSDENEWFVMLEVPKYNEAGEEIVYEWKEVQVPGYHIESTYIIDVVTTIINRVYEVPYFPPGQPHPKIPGRPVATIEIEDYKTALGIGVTINHVGDCFD